MKRLPDELHWSVWALSRPMEEQLGLFPSQIPAAEELGLEFEEHYEPSRRERSDQWTEAQISSLSQLHEQLVRMSGPDHLELWLDEDSLARTEWGSVRALASQVLNAFGVESEKPGRNSVIYITEREGE